MRPTTLLLLSGWMDFCQCVIPVCTLNDDPRVYETENESLLNEQKCNIDTYEDGGFLYSKEQKQSKRAESEIWET